MKKLRRLYYQLFPTYRRLELKCLDWDSADRLIKSTQLCSDTEQWHIAKEEDSNHIIGMVYLESKERITQ